MQKGITLQELAAKIEGLSQLKKDYIAPTEELTMQVTQGAGDERPVIALEVPDPHIGRVSLPVLETAHDQIGARLGIPAKYYDAMKAEAPDLLATNVNAWFRLKPERRMVRSLGGDVRAFLSNKYRRREHEDLAKVSLPILADIPDVRIASCEITERRMYIQALAPRITGEVKVGDAVQAGVVISNIEIGHGAVSVSPLIYRLRCLNGMISADGRFRAYHVGKQVDDTEELWQDDTRKADDDAIMLKVRDMVRAAVDETAFRVRLGKLADLTEQKITGDPSKVVEVLANKVSASEFEAGGILRSLIEGGDLSAWGLLNAVTAQAHTGTYDRAVELEQAGGLLLDLDPREWTKVLAAA